MRAQGNALAFNSTSYVSASQSLQTQNPFTDRDPCSPATGYTGPTIYGGVASTGGGGVVDLWQLYNDNTNGDGPRFRLSATSPAGSSTAAVFLWNRDDFAAGYKNVAIHLDSSSCTLSFTGQLFGSATAKTVRFVVQDDTGNYFITNSTWTIPGSVGTVTLSDPSNVSQTWNTYDPSTDNIGSSASPHFGKIFETGVRLAITKTNGTATVTVQLNAFNVTAVSVTNTDSVMGLTAQSESESRVNLAWTANSSAVKYVVHRSTTSGFTPGPTNLVNEMAINAFQDYRLSAATNYYYRVGAVDGSGATTYSDEIQVMTDAPEGSVARHPSIHFSGKEISELQTKIASAPWSTWYSSRRTLALNNLTVTYNGHSYSNDKDPSTFDPSAAGYVACKDRGDIVVAFALVWALDSDATLKAACLAELKTYLAAMPTNKSTIITPPGSGGSLPNPCYYTSPLYVSYGCRGYALAYDIAYHAFTPTERATYQSNLQLHADLLNDSSFTEPSSGTNVSLWSQHNNWVEVMGGGLAMTGAAIRDYVVSSTNWGQTYLATALSNLTRGINPSVAPFNPQIKGAGAYIEGETYSALAGYWASEGLQALRSANYGSVDLFASTPYQNWLKYRTRSFAPNGNTVQFQAARETSSDSERWVTCYLHEVQGDAASQANLQWLRDVYLTANTDMSSAICRYPRGTPIAQPVPAASYVDPSNGLAFFRSGNPTATTSDDTNSLLLTFGDNPYPGTIVDYRDTTKTIPLTHRRSGTGSLELWGYGAYLVNEPGYYTGADSAETGHITWATTDAEAHNNLEIGGYSPHRYVDGEGFTAWSTGHKLEFVNGLVRKPFIPDSAYDGTTANPTLPSPEGSLSRTIVFVRPTSTGTFDGGYFLVFDNVTTNSTSDTVNWYIHGGPRTAPLSNPSPAANLSFPTGQDALWSSVVPRVGTTNVNVIAHQAVPHASGGVFATPAQTKTFHEYWTGSTATDDSKNNRFDSDFTYGSASGATNYQYLTVLFPYTGSSGPAFNDITVGSVVEGTTIGATTSDNSKFAVTQSTNSSITTNGVACNGINYYVRMADSSTIDCYFAEACSSLLTDPTPSYGFSTSGSPATLLNDIVVDRYDSVAKQLRGTVAYSGVSSSFDLTLKDAGLPSSGGTLTVTLQQGSSFSASITCSAGQVIVTGLPANSGSTVQQFDFVITYP